MIKGGICVGCDVMKGGPVIIRDEGSWCGVGGSKIGQF